MKIEPGCLALVIISHIPSNIGKTVKVNSFIGSLDDYHGSDRWSIDDSIIDSVGDAIYHIREIQLIRIDGFNCQKANTKELMHG